MPDNSSSNVPAKNPPLDRNAIERVLARASELQATSANTDSSGLLTEAELMEIGKEAGISSNTLTQALAEERSRIAVVEEQGFVASITGPAVATASRTVKGSPIEVLAAIDSHMQREECLRVQRRFPDRVTWEPRSGVIGQLQRSLNLGGRGYHLTRASQVAATIIPVDAERVLVRLDADLSHARSSRVRVAAGALVAGILGSGAVAVLGTLVAAPEAIMIVGTAAAVPTLLGATAGYQVGKGHRQLVMRAQLALEQTLDRLEFGSHRRIK
jgi:membrane protein YqaA with SNARE-associated domain